MDGASESVNLIETMSCEIVLYLWLLIMINDNKMAEVAMVLLWCTCAMGHCVCLYVVIRWGSGNRTLDSIRSEKTFFDFGERREETKTNYGSFAGGFCPISPLILLYFIWNWEPSLLPRWVIPITSPFLDTLTWPVGTWRNKYSRN